MHTAAGETPTWDDKAFRYSCHHGIVSGDTAYVTWRDGGVTLLDVSDRAKPAADRAPQLDAALRRRHP